MFPVVAVIDIAMIPIHELLNRIRWDKESAQGDFVIGYYDRVAERIVRVPVCEIILASGDHFAFDLLDHDRVPHSIPLHRIKEVWMNKELISLLSR